MQIALVRRNFASQGGGAERYAATLAQQLAARGHEITLVAETVDPDLRRSAAWRQVRLGRCGRRNGAFARQAAAVLDDCRVDVSFGMARVPGVDIYRVTDGLHAHWMQVRYPGSSLRRIQQLNPRHRELLRLEQEVLTDPTLCSVVVQSELDRRLVQERYGVEPAKIHCIHNGVDTRRFRPPPRGLAPRVRAAYSLPTRGPLLVFVAANNFLRKGLEEVLHALPSIKNRATHLMVVGGDRRGWFHRTIRALRLQSRVILAGPQLRTQPFYAAGGLLVLPTRYEPFPNTGLEALACGMPVLTSPHSGCAEVIRHGETGYITSARSSPAELAQLVDAHFSQTDCERRRMRRRCRAKAAGLSWQHHVDQVEERLKLVARDRCRHR